MDLIDLLIGSEGTLGIVTAVTLRVLPVRPAICLAFVPFRDRRAALGFVRRLRDTAMATWQSHDPRGIDVAAIEQMDARCLALHQRRRRGSRQRRRRCRRTREMALLVTLELPAGDAPRTGVR